MKYIITALMALATAGCTNLGTLQADCEKTSPNFPAMTRCLDNALAGESRFANNPRVQLYRLKAAQLSGRVEKKQIEEIDARVELQQMYVQLRRDQMADVNAAVGDDPIPGSKSIKTNCTTYGNNTTCTSK